MNKRSAMVIAAGLVAALLAGAAAFSIGFGGGPAPAVASSKARKPIVRTIKRTVTVHKKAKDGSNGTARVITLPAPSSNVSSGSSGGYSDGEDDQYGGSSDDQYEYGGGGGGSSGGGFEGGDD